MPSPLTLPELADLLSSPLPPTDKCSPSPTEWSHTLHHEELGGTRNVSGCLCLIQNSLQQADARFFPNVLQWADDEGEGKLGIWSVSSVSRLSSQVLKPPLHVLQWLHTFRDIYEIICSWSFYKWKLSKNGAKCNRRNLGGWFFFLWKPAHLCISAHEWTAHGPRMNSMSAFSLRAFPLVASFPSTDNSMSWPHAGAKDAVSQDSGNCT